jgi:hypothetical protein
VGLRDSPFRVGKCGEFGAWPAFGIPVLGTLRRVTVLVPVDLHWSTTYHAHGLLLTTYPVDTGFIVVPRRSASVVVTSKA